jgi:hypothetical protein
MAHGRRIATALYRTLTLVEDIRFHLLRQGKSEISVDVFEHLLHARTSLVLHPHHPRVVGALSWFDITGGADIN